MSSSGTWRIEVACKILAKSQEEIITQNPLHEIDESSIDVNIIWSAYLVHEMIKKESFYDPLLFYKTINLTRKYERSLTSTKK